MYVKNLNRADRRAIDAAIRKAKKEDKKQQSWHRKDMRTPLGGFCKAKVLSCQDTIPFKQMFRDGICRVDDNYYTKTIRFQDINYQLNQNEDKTAIFDGWSDFLNYFDSSVHFELSFMNLSTKEDSYSKRLVIEPQSDDFDEIREEYSEMLQDRLSRGNNGLIKTKYITFGIEANNIKTAKPRLERVENDILNKFKRLGVSAHSLNGTERLKVMYDMFHLDASEPFRLSWDWLPKTGLSVKDFIAPSSFEFRNGYAFKVGDKHGSAYLRKIPDCSGRGRLY